MQNQHVCTIRQSQVLDTRSIMGGVVIRRRRECESCGQRFSTYELPNTLFATNLAEGLGLLRKVLKQSEAAVQGGEL
jgi:hypothetical protein